MIFDNKISKKTGGGPLQKLYGMTLQYDDDNLEKGNSTFFLYYESKGLLMFIKI